jgi:3-oxoadipate enol-lactonase
MILQDFYGRYADRVATLALVDTSVGFGSVSEEVRRDFLARRLDPLERGLMPADIAPGVVEVLMAKSATAVARQRMRTSIEALRVAPYKQALHAIITTDFRAILPHINVPTLVIVGDEDVVTPPPEAEFLARNIPGAKLVTIPGAGHLTNIEKPEAFNAALEAFLKPHATRASVVSLGGA